VSRVDGLIPELTSAGVRHALLSDVADYSSTRVDAAELDETSFVGVDNLVADKGGRIDATYLPNTARLTAYEPGDILLGNIRPYLKKVWCATNEGGCSGDVLAIRVNGQSREELDSEFLYYVLSSDGFFTYNMQHAKGAKMPRGNKTAILNYRIPIPPIELQREIVIILDQFRALVDALESEIQERRAQRTALAINFAVKSRDAEAGKNAVTKVSLGTLAREVVDPIRVRPDESYVNLGVKWNGEGVLTREPRSGAEIKATTLYGVSPGQLVYNRMFVVEGSFALIPPECGGAVVSNEFPVFDIDSSAVEPEWLLHYLCDPYTLARIEAEVTGTERGTMKSRRRWKQEQFARFVVEMPTLKRQREILRVLRVCDDLIGSLSDELVARRKQYEYYRDKLLTFEEASA